MVPLSGNDFQVVAQGAACARPPNEEARNQNKDEHQCAHAHDGFSPREFTALVVAQQPAVEGKHRFEKRRALVAADDFAGVGIDEHHGVARLRESHLGSGGGVGIEFDARGLHAVGEGLRHVVHEGGERQPRSGDAHGVALGMEQAGDFALKHEHRAGEADKGQDDAERHAQPEMDFAESFLHKFVEGSCVVGDVGEFLCLFLWLFLCRMGKMYRIVRAKVRLSSETRPNKKDRKP